MINHKYIPSEKDSQFAKNVHFFVEDIVKQLVEAFYKTLPDDTGILRAGYNIDKDGQYIKGSVSRYVRSDTEEELFRIQLDQKLKPILYIKV